MQYRHLPPVARQDPRVAGREGRQDGLEVIHRTCPPASAVPRAARHSPAWNSPEGRRGSPRPRSRRHRGSRRCYRSPNPADWGRRVSAGWRRRGGGLPPSPPPARRGSAGNRFVLDLFGQRVEIGCHVLPPGSGVRDTTARGRSALSPGAAIIARAGAGVARSLADARARAIVGAYPCLPQPERLGSRAGRPGDPGIARSAGSRPVGDGRRCGGRGKLPEPDLHWRLAVGRLSPVLHSSRWTGAIKESCAMLFGRKSRAVESAAKDEDLAWRLDAIGQNVATIRFLPMARYCPPTRCSSRWSATRRTSWPASTTGSSAKRTTRPPPPTCASGRSWPAARPSAACSSACGATVRRSGWRPPISR